MDLPKLSKLNAHLKSYTILKQPEETISKLQAHLCVMLNLCIKRLPSANLIWIFVVGTKSSIRTAALRIDLSSSSGEEGVLIISGVRLRRKKKIRTQTECPRHRTTWIQEINHLDQSLTRLLDQQHGFFEFHLLWSTSFIYKSAFGFQFWCSLHQFFAKTLNYITSSSILWKCWVFRILFRQKSKVS